MKSIASTRSSLIRILPVICCIGHAMGAAVVPSWAGEAGTTHHTYTFSTDDATPEAGIAQSTFGTPDLMVTLGLASSGWQNPGEEFTSPGVNDDGAWDLGNQGYMEISLPVAAAAAAVGTHYRIDFVVFVTGMVTPTAMPSLSAVGLNPQDLVILNETGPMDGMLSHWDNRTWTGYYDSVTADSISLRISAPSTGSVIDTFEVYTRLTVVPEPSSALLAMFAGVAGCLRRRRD